MTDFPRFVPHPLLRSGHLQTIAGVYLKGPLRPYRATPHQVMLPDGDRLVLHDDCPVDWRSGDRVALLLHGVAGCHGSSYLVRIAGKLNDVGVRTFRMDMRGCGAGARLAQFPGHAGRSEDALAAADTIQQLATTSPLTIIGFSMGGNIALKLAGELGDRPPSHLVGIVAVAPPIDLMHCGENIDRGFNQVYSRSFARQLVRFLQSRREHMPLLADLPLLPAPRRIVEFDDRFTAPLSGFRDVTDYYQQSSSLPVLSRITLPTLILSAADDPLIPVEMLQRAPLSPSTEIVLTEHGGHVAYIGQNSDDPDRWWMDWRIVDWVMRRP